MDPERTSQPPMPSLADEGRSQQLASVAARSIVSESLPSESLRP